MSVTDPRAMRSRQTMIDAAGRLLERGGIEEVTHQTVAMRSAIREAIAFTCAQ